MFQLSKIVFFGIITSAIYSASVQAQLPLPDLPEPVTNNAVALVSVSDKHYVISFMGLGEKKDYQAVHNKVWVLELGQSQWQNKKPVPSTLPLHGRLASTAVGVGSSAYVFGGYTVSEDHSEVSSPDNVRYDVSTDTYQPIANMPVPVDDAIALAYQQRYIYVVSGWHNDGNVNLVQVYDIQTDSWHQASPFVGQPVFGHAGGMVGNKMLVCDGVKVVPFADKRRSFAMQTGCFLGVINAENPFKIAWYSVTHPTGIGRYRMAASAIANNKVVFIGGSTNPYNYDGIGYNGNPSFADNRVWQFDLSTRQWQTWLASSATMDHRGLLVLDQNWFTVGGMSGNQNVLDKMTSYRNK